MPPPPMKEENGSGGAGGAGGAGARGGAFLAGLRAVFFFAEDFFAAPFFAPARIFLRDGAAFFALFFAFDFDFFAFLAINASRSVAAQTYCHSTPPLSRHRDCLPRRQAFSRRAPRLWVL